jgi:hypothetical protein
MALADLVQPIDISIRLLSEVSMHQDKVHLAQLRQRTSKSTMTLYIYSQ